MSRKLLLKAQQYLSVMLLLILMATLTLGVSAQTTTTPLPDAAGLLQEFNRWRTAIGIRPYQEDVRLSASAQFHSDDMATRNYFAHTARSPILCNGVNVSQPHERANCFGTFDRGEGIFVGRPTADEATRGWINSYGHCLGVMNPTATHLGGGNNGDYWTFQFNGVNEPDPPIQSEVFCNCTKGNSDESHIQSCVQSFNNQFNNGATPPVPPASQLQITARIPGDKNVTYNNTSAGGQSFGYFSPGTLTIRMVPVSGNPSGINIELADGNFDRIPGQTGIDSLVYEVTERSEFSIWFSGREQAPGDTFYFDVLWVDNYVSPSASNGQETAAIQPNEEIVVSDAPVGCSADGGDAIELTVTNNTSEQVSMNWVNFECGETLYHIIEPGTTIQQGTFVGHEWVMRNSNNEALMYLLSSADNTNIVIDSAVSIADEIAEEGVFTEETSEQTEEPFTMTGTGTYGFEEIAECDAYVGTVQTLIDAIHRANDEAQCPGLNTIFVFEDLVITQTHDGGPTAFPNITSPISIESMNRMLTRDENAPAFRFFYVDGHSQQSPSLDLKNIKLVNGGHGEDTDGAGVFVDARDGGAATFSTSNTDFVNNHSSGNGGGVMILTMGGGYVTTTMTGGVFDGNSALYGGGFYNGGFDGGTVYANITNVNFINNQAQIEGSALYNNGIGTGSYAEMTLIDSHFTNNTAPTGDTIQNNGRSGGHVSLNFPNITADTSGNTVGTYFIMNSGYDGGNAMLSWNNALIGDPAIYSCVSNVGMTVECQ